MKKLFVYGFFLLFVISCDSDDKTFLNHAIFGKWDLIEDSDAGFFQGLGARSIECIKDNTTSHKDDPEYF